MLCIVFGTRPEAVKLYPLTEALRQRNVPFVLCSTGQHKELLTDTLRVLGMTPDVSLPAIPHGATLSDITQIVAQRMHSVFLCMKPDTVVVHGDTTSAFAAALSAFYLRIPVAHVEAGLRTYRTDAPYPEEFNRRAIDVAAKTCFAPTAKAAEHLLNEGKRPTEVYITGNTVTDVLRKTVTEDFTHPLLTLTKNARYILLTIHRRENLDGGVIRIFRAVRRLSEAVPDVHIVCPLHVNPVIGRAAAEIFSFCDRIHLLPPLDVISFHNFLSRCCFVLTDSGGVQEEAAFLGKPTLVARDVTEREEGIEAGVLHLVGTEEENVYRACLRLLTDESTYRKAATKTDVFGDGHAGERIADILLQKETERA